MTTTIETTHNKIIEKLKGLEDVYDNLNKLFKIANGCDLADKTSFKLLKTNAFSLRSM